MDSRGPDAGDARVRDGAARDLDRHRRRPAEPGPTAGVDPRAALVAALYERGRRHVLLEGGPTLAAAFLDAGLVDEALVYLAPLLLGAGRPALAAAPSGTLADAHRADLQRRRPHRPGPAASLPDRRAGRPGAPAET